MFAAKAYHLGWTGVMRPSLRCLSSSRWNYIERSITRSSEVDGMERIDEVVVMALVQELQGKRCTRQAPLDDGSHSTFDQQANSRGTN